MNRIDRLLGYVLALQGGATQTAETLAARFEVSRRTAYRDLQALSQLGVPLLSTPGRGYSLMPGYHLPPVMLTAEEASSLALAGGLFRHFVAHEGRVALDLALRKIEAVLPERTRAEVAETQRLVCLTDWPRRAAPLDGELPRLIQQAMRERRRLAVVYHSRSRRQTQECTIEPYALVYYAGDWHVLAADAAEDRESNADAADRPIRQFRLSRMEQPRLLGERYEIPVGMDARAFWANNNPSRFGERVAQVRFGKDVARWARERRHYSWETEQETQDGLLVTLRVERWEELLPWLLGWGGDAEVLAPPDLRGLLLQTAESMLATYTRPVAP